MHAKLLLTIADIEEEVDKRRQAHKLERLYADIKEEHASLEIREDYVESDSLKAG